jgi:uncharacterized protein involved in propanediol utilization
MVPLPNFRLSAKQKRSKLDKLTQTEIIKKIEKMGIGSNIAKSIITKVQTNSPTTRAFQITQASIEELPQHIILVVDKFGTVTFYENTQKLAKNQPLEDQVKCRTLCKILNLPQNAVLNDQIQQIGFEATVAKVNRIYNEANCTSQYIDQLTPQVPLIRKV